jgi:hypothetical protein
MSLHRILCVSFLRPRWALFLTALGAGLLFPAAGHATSVVLDTWQDGIRSDPPPTLTAPFTTTYSEYGVDQNADGDIESAWFGSLTGSPAVAALSSSPGHLLMSNSYNGTNTTGSSSYTTYFTPGGTAVNLANPGDFLKVTWVFTPTAAATQTNTSQNFRLALANSGGTRATAEGGPPSAAYTGYSMFMNMSIASPAGGTANLGNSAPFQLKRRTATTVTDLLSTGGNWGTNLANGATSGTHGFDTGTQYTFTMLLTRNASNGIDFDVETNGGTVNNSGQEKVLFTDTTPGTTGGFTFDTFGLRPSSSATTADLFDTTLFQVETNAQLVSVPEPASVTLLGIAAATVGLAAFRRRKA